KESGVRTACPSPAIVPSLDGMTGCSPRRFGQLPPGIVAPRICHSRLLTSIALSLDNRNGRQVWMPMPPRPQPSSTEAPGFAARRIAADILDGVLRRARPLDERLDGKGPHVGLAHRAERARALVRRIVAGVLRRLGSLRHVVGTFLDRGLPRDAPRAETALLIGAAQILLLGGPAH